MGYSSGEYGEFILMHNDCGHFSGKIIMYSAFLPDSRLAYGG